jgi:hypothetical protein
VRPSCIDCARKHLAQAIVICHELPYYAGNQEDDHFWIAIGHLAEAEAQVQKVQPFTASAIREDRLKLMTKGPEEAYGLDLGRHIRMITETAQPEATVLGPDVPSVTI